MPKIVVLDNLAVAESIATALKSHEAIEQARFAGSVADLKALIAEEPTHVLVVDVATDNVAERLGVCDLASVKSGESRVLFLARHNDRSLLEMTRTRGASGFLLKSRPLTVVASAIQIVASGGDVFENHSQPMPPRIARPSQRELELLHALARGLTNAAIAHELEISARTVESHLRRMFARYLVASRAQLLILAMHEGWLA